MKTCFSTSAVLFIATLFLSACSREPQPTKSDIEQALTTLLPAFSRVTSLSVDAIQNLGTKVEPDWNARFHATIKVTSDTFVVVDEGTDSEVTFVQLIKREGEATEIFGKSVSRLYAGSWRTSLNFEGEPIPALGMPQSAFRKKVIVRGSKSETDYLAKQEEKWRLAMASTQREMEERRAAETRAAEQNRLAEERVNEENRRMLDDAPKLLIGTWRDENSLSTYLTNGTVTLKFDGGATEKTTWSIDGDIIVRKIFEIDDRPVKDGKVFHDKIVKITKTVIISKSLDNGSEFHATRIK